MSDKYGYMNSLVELRKNSTNFSHDRTHFDRVKLSSSTAYNNKGDNSGFHMESKGDSFHQHLFR